MQLHIDVEQLVLLCCLGLAVGLIAALAVPASAPAAFAEAAPRPQHAGMAYAITLVASEFLHAAARGMQHAVEHASWVVREQLMELHVPRLVHQPFCAELGCSGVMHAWGVGGAWQRPVTQVSLARASKAKIVVGWLSLSLQECGSPDSCRRRALRHG